MNNGSDLGILLQAKLDLQKTISNINSDLKAIANQVQALNLNIDTSNLTKDINQQVKKINKSNTEIVIDTNLDDMPKEITDVGKYVDNLKKKFNVSSVSIKRDVDVANQQMKSLLITLKQVDGVTRQIRMTPTPDSTMDRTKYEPQFLTVDDKREEASLKKLQERINLINKNREQADKLFQTEQKRTAQLQNQLEIEQRMAAIRVQDLRRRYNPILTPEQNQQLDSYVQSMRNLQATSPNVQQEMRRLNTSFKEVSANVAEAGSRTDSFAKQLGVAMSRIPIWMIGMTAFYAPLRGIQNAIDQIVMLDSQMTELRRVMDATPQTYNNLMQESIALATELGNRVEDVNQAMVEFARQGYDPSTLIALTETATVAANISELTTTEAMSSLTAAMKSFNVEANDSLSILDRLNEVNKICLPA